MQIGQCQIESFRLAHDAAQNALFVRIESQELFADCGQSCIGICICLRSFLDANRRRNPLHIVPLSVQGSLLHSGTAAVASSASKSVEFFAASVGTGRSRGGCSSESIPSIVAVA